MRFRLLHYTSFVPILSCLIVDPWGLKFCWLFYLFFMYLVLERREWNGYSLGTWLVLQRAAETCMVFSLALSRISPWLSPLAWLTLKDPRRPPFLYALCCFALYASDPLQIAFMLGMVISEYSTPPRDWQGAVYHRILTRCVQVTSLVIAYRTGSHRLTLITFVILLKVLCFLVRPDDVSKARWWNGAIPAILELNIKDHTL
jgi:hypothetical protein